MDSLLRHKLMSGTAEQATGCGGAGDYATYAESKGYNLCEVLNWSSSAGDWQFVVSKDGKTWYILDQVNNYPRSGFTRTISDGVDNPDWRESYEGSLDDVYKQIEAMY